MDADIDGKIADLREMARKELLEEWEKFYGHKPPKKMGRQLLVRSIAYKYQEEAFGGLSPEIRKELERLIRLYRREPNNGFKKKIKFKPGTRFIRSWKGKLHEVTATESGFFYQGHEYRSLTKVADKITGTHWAGTKFFGVDNKGKAPKVEVAS